MTTATPRDVKVEYTAYVTGDSGNPLPVTNIVASMDRDRVSFCEATLECTALSETQLADLDPRNGVTVAWRAELQELDGTIIHRIPDYAILPGSPAVMWVRTVQNDPLNNSATIRLAGGESMMDDKIRNAGTTNNTGATTVAALVDWSLGDVFGGYTVTHATVASATAIAAGDRRLMLQGESHMDLVKPELDAINCRLLDFWGLLWSTKVRDDVNGTLELSTIPGVAGADPIVYEYTESISRDGEWADGVLVKYDYENSGGTRVVAYQASGAGANTRGVVLNRDRAAPAANAADQIVTRTVVRGYDIDVTARLFFDFDAYFALIVHLPGGVEKESHIRSVTWDIGAGEMRIRAQSGNPL